MRFALWGFHRGDYAYEVMPAQRAALEGLTPIACPDWSRDYVTVATR